MQIRINKWFQPPNANYSNCVLECLDTLVETPEVKYHPNLRVNNYGDFYYVYDDNISATADSWEGVIDLALQFFSVYF